MDVLTLSRTFTESRRRNRWLEPGTLRVRTSQPGRSARFDVGDGSVRMAAWFTGKGPAKSSVQLQVDRLRGSDDVEREKALWRDRLATLADVLRT